MTKIFGSPGQAGGGDTGPRVGEVRFFPGVSSPPAGWILCDGRGIAYGQYPALDAVWGIQQDTIGVGVTSSVENMTAPTSTNQTALASSEYNVSYAAWRAFQTNNPTSGTDLWTSAGQATPQWLRLQFTNKPRAIRQLQIRSGPLTTDPVPSAFVFQGSQDAATWYDLTEPVTGFTLGINTDSSVWNVTKNKNAYSYVRLYITAHPSGVSYSTVGRFRIFEAAAGFSIPTIISGSGSGLYCLRVV